MRPCDEILDIAKLCGTCAEVAGHLSLNIDLFLIIDDMDDMEEHRPFFHKRNLLNSAASLTALSAQFVISLLMASSHQDKAFWNDKETLAFVEYLCENVDKRAEGMTFRETVFNGAPDHIAHLLTSGPAKTAKHCKTKFNTVSTFFVKSRQ